MAADREQFRMDAAGVAAKLNGAKRTGAGWVACCPAHDDRMPSLSLTDSSKGLLVHCHAGCSQDAVLDALEGLGVSVRKPKQEADILHPLLDVASLAVAKRLSAETLNANFVQDAQGGGVMFCYADAEGAVTGTKFRKYLGGGSDRGFSWSRGSKPCLYGLWRLERDYANDGRVILCEGETDALTLWQHGYTALALPGASMWKDEWADLIPAGAKVYVVIEPDQGGRTVQAAIEKSPLKSRAHLIRMSESTKDPSALHLQGEGFTEAFDKLIASAEPVEKPKPRNIKLRHISEILAEKREPNWLIHKTLEANIIGVIAGPRAAFKSFIALHWTMLAAIDGNSAIIMSAEGGGLDRRVDAWLRTFAPAFDAKDLPLVALEKAINLNSAEVLAELQEVIGEGGQPPKLILIDTFSKYSPGIDENDNGEVALFINSLSATLRERYGCTVLIVAHSGHGDAKRPRGAYTLMANPDAEYIVERPDPIGMAVSVSRDRFKDSPSMPALTYTAESVDLGRVDRYGDPVTSLIVRQADQPLMKKGPTGKAQRALLSELERLTESGADKVGVWTQEAMRGICRDIGFSKSTARDAVLGLVSMRFLIPTVGGYCLDSKEK